MDCSKLVWSKPLQAGLEAVRRMPPDSSAEAPPALSLRAAMEHDAELMAEYISLQILAAFQLLLGCSVGLLLGWVIWA